MLVKSKTVVVAMLITCLTITAPVSPAFAAEDSGKNPCDTAVAKWVNETDPEKKQNLYSDVARCASLFSNKELGADCASADQAFANQVRLFATACSGATLTGDALKCGAALAQCECTNTSTDSARRTQLKCPTDVLETRTTASSPNQSYNIEAERQKVKLCPVVEQSVRKDLEAQILAAKPFVQQMRPELQNRKDAVDKAESELESSLQTIDEERRAAKAEHKRALAAARRERSERAEKSTLELDQAYASKADAEEALRNAQNSASAEKVKYQDQLVQIEIACHDNATAEILRRQEIFIAQRRAGIPAGDQHQVLANVGITSRKAWKRLHHTLVTRCMREDAKTKLSRQSAAATLKNNLENWDSQILRAQSRVKEISNRITSIRSPNCISSSGNESRECREARLAASELKDMEQVYQDRMETFDEKRKSVEKSGTAALKSAKESLRNARNDFNGETARLRNFQEMHSVLSRATEVTAEAKKALSEAHGGMEARATTLVSCANTPGENIPCGPNSSCNLAYQFLKSIGMEPTMPQDNSPTPRTPSVQTTTADEPERPKGHPATR